MKFLFVLEHYEPYLGGAEKLFRQVTQLLVQQGHEVQVITTLYRPDLPLKETIGGVNIHRVKCYNRFLFTLFSLPALWKTAKEADFIHTTTYNAAPPAWLVAKLRRKPVIITYHEHWGELWFKLPFLGRWQKLLFFAFEWLISRLPFDHYVAVSEATVDSLLTAGISASRISRIYNGINYNDYSPASVTKDEYFSVVFVGRLGVSKGLDLLIPAWGKFSQKHLDKRILLRLVVPTYPAAFWLRIQDLVAIHCQTDTIELLHELPREELVKTMQRSHALAIPSYSEGFCFVAAEAVALGVPIISSGKKALSEVVSGPYITMEEHTIEALVRALEQAIENEWQERPVREFSLLEAGEHYANLYQRLSEN